MRAIGTYIQYLSGECEKAEIIGYEIRKNVTYLIVKGFALEEKVNLLNEGRVFRFVE